MSLVLRHQPGAIGLTLDESGWASVDDLLRCMDVAKKMTVSREVLDEVVAENDKQRFGFSEDGKRIRANQGHSLEIELGLQPVDPPERLYHGTATRFLDAIFRDGLIPGSRQHVHLSADRGTAIKVGSRHGKPVVLSVDTLSMVAAGCPFFCSENGVWLAEAVKPEYLTVEQ